MSSITPNKKVPKQLSLSSREVCEIISLCDAHKVAKLKFRDLELSFIPKDESLPFGEESVDIATKSPTNEIVEIQTKVAEEEFELEKLKLREEQLEELKITNPVEFERQMLNGDLDDNDTDESELDEYESE